MPSRNSSCTNCALWSGAKTVCLDGDGPMNARIMVVGEAPGQQEDETGRPFVGDAGRELDGVLKMAGLSRSDVRVTNTVRCRPPGNRTPTSAEQQACMGYLMDEIDEVKPEVLVLLGNAPLQTITGGTGITKMRGKLLQSKPKLRLSLPIVATFHPAYYLHAGRDPNILNTIASDLSMARRLVSPLEQEVERAIFTQTVDPEQLTSSLDRISSKVITFDLEWTGAPGSMYWPWRKGAQLYSIAFTGEGDGKMLSVATPWPNMAYDTSTFIKLFKTAVQRFFDQHLAVAHNAQADLLWLTHHGVSIRLAGDTMLLAQLIDEGRSLSLESLATSLTETTPGWKIPPRAQRPSQPWEWEELLNYNINDTEATYRLAKKLHQQLQSLPAPERDNIRRFYTNVSLPAVAVFVDMALAGTRIDEDQLKKLTSDSNEASDKAAFDLARLIEKASVQSPTIEVDEARNIATSPQATVKVLQSVFNIPITSSARTELDAFKDAEVVQKIQAIRHEQKRQGTYLAPWAALLDECVDRRLHSVYRQAGARTGRTSAELEMGGSIQVAPREMKSLYCAAPGNVIVAGDYSQMELRIIAWLANEPTMIEVYRKDRDIHLRTALDIDKPEAQRTATIILGRAPYSHAESVELLLDYPGLTKKFPVWAKRRQDSKGVNFGFAYKMGEEKFQLYASMSYNVQVTRKEAHDFREDYFRLYNHLPPWHEACEKDWQQNGYVVTPLGRYRHRVEDARQAINTPVQATGSDLGIIAMIRLRKAIREQGLDAKIIAFVHDCILIECSQNIANKVNDLLVDVMEHPPLQVFGISNVPVPFKADIKTAEHWG